MNRIKLLRTERGIKQAELAAFLNVGQNTLSNWESDKHSPDFETVKKISDFFETTSDYILGLSDDPRSSNKKNSLSPEKLKLLDKIGYAYYGGEDKELDDEDVDTILEIVALTRKAHEKRDKK